MQTILGGGGSIGSYLAKELINYTDKIRIVSRNPQKINDSDELFPANLTDPEQVDKAIKGSDVVYAVIGFPYKIKAWKEMWPPFIRSVLDSCKKYNAKLVFFDNIYMYDPDYLNGMNEDTPFRPVSKKGRIRKEVAEEILNDIEKKELTALIARAPDFMNGQNSVLKGTVLDNFKKGKAAYWPGRTDKIHNYIFTPDAAKAVAMLGNTDDAYNQTWHLPTPAEKFTGREWVEMCAKIMSVKPKVKVLKTSTLTILGIFVPVMREIKEMNYQYELDYLFDSSKFMEKFNFEITPVDKALKHTIESL